MSAVMAVFLVLEVQQGPVSNGHDFGSCLTPSGRPVDLRAVVLSQDRQLSLESRVGRVRLALEEQRFRFELVDSRDDEQVVGDVGDIIGEEGERADVFLTLGVLDARSVIYWRETYQHRIFRQGILTISPEALGADWTQVLSPHCEGRGGVYYSHGGAAAADSLTSAVLRN